MNFANVKEWYIPDETGTMRDVWWVKDSTNRVIWRKKFYMKYYQNDSVIDTYSTRFYGNGSTSGSTATITGKAETSYVMPANGFVKTGYTFAGKWNTSPIGSGDDYIPGQTYTHSSDLILYAQWTINNYTISFYGNGATSGSMSSMSVPYQQGTILTANAFVRDGYNFTEWCETADGTGQRYSDEDWIKMPAKNLDLYAQWEEVQV